MMSKVPKIGPYKLVVGIGGRAGFADFLKTFIPALKKKSDMVYLISLPDAVKNPKSLFKKAPLAVVDVKNKVLLKPNHIYLVPHNRTVAISDGILSVKPAKSVSDFFKNIAEGFGSKAVGISLSKNERTVIGLKQIKALGGMTVSSNPDLHGIVDHVISAAEIPLFLSRLAPNASSSDNKEQDLMLDQICSILRKKTGHDFSSYKKTTLIRRIERRIQSHGIETFKEYAEFLENDIKEPKDLLQDLLISVTRFFRDPEAFSVVESDIIPKLFDDPDKRETSIRIWVPACATGEEAYTLAMLLLDYREQHNLKNPILVFATDIDQKALAHARSGKYLSAATADIPIKFLKKYFRTVDDGYQVTDVLRELCIFSEHNLTKDPPFSKVDLITCRNLFIYWDSELQKKTVSLFHYALNKNGYLFLGPAENIVGTQTLFKVLDKKHRLFRRIENTAQIPSRFNFSKTSSLSKIDLSEQLRPKGERDLGRIIAASLLDNHAPPAVVINEKADILFISGRTGRYLEPATGTLSYNLFDLIRKNIRPELHALVHRAVKTHKEETHLSLAFESDGIVRQVQISIKPLKDIGEGLELFIVVFNEVSSPDLAESAKPEEHEALSRDSVTDQLESELRETREHLQSTIEEVKSSNEELLSMNEELQSANEELETSKEELQSTNEELETVNSELSRKVEEVDRANSDLQNFFENTQVPTIFLDGKFRVQKFTPTTNKVFRLIPADIGRVITDIVALVEVPELIGHVETVLRGLVPIEKEVQSHDRLHYFIMRINPYRTINNVIDGVVVTFVDVTELKKVQEQQARLAAIVESSNDAIIGCDDRGMITTWNQGCERLYWYTEREAIGSHISLVVPSSKREESDKIFARALQGEFLAGVETERLRKDGKSVFVSLTLSCVRDGQGRISGVSSISRDITDKRKAEEVQARLAAIVESSEDAIIAKSLDGIVTHWNRAAERLLGYTAEEMIGKPIFKVVPPDHPEDVTRILNTIKRGERIKHFETVRVHKNGTRVDVSLSVSPILDASGNIIGASKVGRDITERKKIEQTLERELKMRDEFISIASHELKTPLTSIKLQTQMAKRKIKSGDDNVFTPERFIKIVDITDQQVDRLNNLVDDMLDVSRIGQGRLNLKLGPVNLAEVVTGTFENLADHIKAAGCEVTLDLEPAIGTWDKYRLEQVVTNLFTNACRYARGKPISVRVRRAGDKFELEFKDQGRGIAKEDHLRIFERFERVGGYEEEGFGMGLYIVKEIIDAHSGRITVESELGKGATFRIILPKGDDNVSDQ